MVTRRVVLNNKQREKSSGQKTREALVLEETARKAAENRQRSGEDLTQIFAEGGEWSEDVGNQLGVSKETVRKGTDVYRMAYPDEYVHDDLQNPEKYDVDEEVRQEAREQQSFHGAISEVEKKQESEKRN